MNTLSTQRVVIFTAWDLITSTGLLWAPILDTSFGSFGVVYNNKSNWNKFRQQ